MLEGTVLEAYDRLKQRRFDKEQKNQPISSARREDGFQI
jgi:hypothetical protein